MNNMMAPEMGTMIWIFPLEVFLMLLAGVFYLICTALLWKPMRQGGNELISALFAFLLYQAISMIFMGMEMQTMNMLYGQIAALAIFVGSAYMLKFLFSSYSRGARRILFILSLIVSLGIFAWFLQSPENEMLLSNFVVWYDLIVNGVLVGGAILLFGIRASGANRAKALAGGSGVVSCCVVSNATMLSGAVLASSFFAFLAPLLILGSIIFNRRTSQ